jgi:hypothetical protein
MSYSTYIYLGPAFRVLSLEKEKQTSYYTCSNKSCKGGKVRMTTDFCPHCGSPAEEVLKVKKYHSDPRDLVALDSFIDLNGAADPVAGPEPGSQYFLLGSNHRASYITSWDSDTRIYMEAPTDEVRAEGIKLFEKEFAEEREVLLANYSSVETLWGIYQYWW